MQCLQKCHVMVTSFGCYCTDGRGALLSPNCWRSCKLWGKMWEGKMGSKRGMVIEVEGIWNLGGMGMLSCMTVGIAMLVCGLVLAVVVVLVVVFVWMVLTMWIVMGVLAVVVSIVMVQRLAEVNRIGVVSGLSSRGFVVVVVLEGFVLVSWSSWKMVLWCLNEREDFLGRFGLMLVAGNMLVAEGMCFFGMVIRWGFSDFFYFYNFLELMEVGLLVWSR